MPPRALILIAALAAQQLPPPFATPWFRKPTRVVAMPDGQMPTAPPGFAVLALRGPADLRALHGARAERRRVPRRIAIDGIDHGASRRRQRRRCRSPRDLRDRPQPPVRSRVLEELSVRRQQRLGDSVHVRGRPDDGEGASREDRRPAAERRRAGSGHRRPVEDSAEPDARLQPLDEKRPVQCVRHEALCHRRLGDQRHAGE